MIKKRSLRTKKVSAPPMGGESPLQRLADRGDPVALSLLYAPIDDEPLTAAEVARLDRAKADVRAGRVRVVKPAPRVVLPRRLRVELDRETDGRFIADVPELRGVLVYGASVVEAIREAQALALEILASELRHGRAIDSIPWFRIDRARLEKRVRRGDPP